MATVLPKSMCGSPLGRCGGPLPIPSPGGSIPRSGRDAAMTRTALALEPADASASEAGDLTERVRTLVTAEWTPLVNAIDKGELYPADILRKLGGIGAWAAHLPADGVADLRPAIAAMAAIGECCGATSFMAWCQNTLAWYVGNTDNAALKARLLSCQRGWGMAITAAWAMPGWSRALPSMATLEIHSPPDLMTSFERSTMSRLPSAWMRAMSPVDSQPPGSFSCFR